MLLPSLTPESCSMLRSLCSKERSFSARHAVGVNTPSYMCTLFIFDVLVACSWLSFLGSENGVCRVVVCVVVRKKPAACVPPCSISDIHTRNKGIRSL